MNNISVGNICRVIHPGYIYPSYKDFAIEAEYPDALISDLHSRKLKNTIVRVLVIKKKNCVYPTYLAVVESINTPNTKFIIDIRAIERMGC